MRKRLFHISFFERLLPLVLLWAMGGVYTMGQTEITEPIVNKYVSVTKLYTAVDSDRDSVDVLDASDFAVSDIVMLYQPKGFLMSTDNGDPTGAFGDVGQYALLVIDEIIGNTIIFNNATQFLSTKDYTVSQLIKVADYDSAVVKNPLTAPAWDSLTGTGGVVALFVRGRLQLEADIDVSGKGFKGAVPFPVDTYSGNCYSEEVLQRKHFLMNAHDTAGLKGEGAVYRNTLYYRGKGRAINGGGGGNGRYAGGGGGGNYLGGGDGAGQSDECGPVLASTAGEGGYGLQGKGLYDDGGLFPNRLFFGGGGGTGVSDFSGITSSPGGNGGGIVVIVADEIYSNGSGAIYADGASINEISDGGGGGGGAGGCIVLDANNFTGNITLSAIGGRGGSTTSGLPVRGPGGGGAGGVYWLRSYDSNVIDTIGMGPNGGFSVVGTDTTKAIPGKLPAIISGSLEVPLRGFLFNTVPPNDSVCSNVIPPVIKASLPKGGVKPYSYKWIQSPDGINWAAAEEVNDQQEYAFTSELSSTTYYRRIVQDAGVLTDTSVNFVYSVLPEIEGNLIATDDVIACEGTDPQTTISPAAKLTGAYVNSDTTFQWQMWYADGETPVAAGGEDAFRDFILPTLYDTTFYRRVVQSGICTSISDTVTIYVLDALGNNSITSKDTLCYGQSPELISGTNPNGGDLANYWYAWEESFVEEGVYDNTLFTSRDLDYADSVLTEDRYFRRIVYSGNDSSCVDTSEIFKIEVLDLISNNRMLFDGTPVLNLDTITICQFGQLPLGGLDGTTPAGGDGIYSYVWQVRDKANPWDDSASYGPGTKFNLDAFGDTTYIRRMVLSGADDVCRDYSDSIVVGVVWEITNNTLTATPETFCQGDELPTLTADEPLGGANGLGRLWQYRTETGDWIQAPGDSAEQNYDFPDRLPETLYFRRYVWSEPSDSVCFSYTDSVKITVQDSILNNDILLINNVPLSDLMVNSIIVDSICAGLDVVLEATGAAQLTGGDGTSYAYAWEESNLADFSVITGTGSGQDYARTDFRDSAFFRRAVASGVCEDTTYLLVHPIVLPSGKLNLAALQADTVCASDELPVELSMAELIIDPLAAEYTVHASYLSPNFSGNDNFTLSRGNFGPIPFFVDTDSAETYVYHLDSIVDDRGCVSEMVDPNEPAIMVYYSPEATLTASDTEICGPAVSLVATNQGGVSWRWLASAVRRDLNGTDTVTINSSGLEAEAILDRWYNDTVVLNYGFLLETSGTIGKSCADTVYVTVTHYQEPEFPPFFIKNAMDDFGDSIAFDQVYFTDRYPLKVDHISASGKGEWSVAEGSPGTLGPDPNNPEMEVVLGDALDVDNIFVWTVSNGVCEAQSDQMIVRRKDVDVYEGISPNGDGLNDVLAMRGIKYADRISLQVFNSWGTKIFSMTEAEEMNYVSLIPDDPDSEELRVLWDGKVNGVVVPDGTYYYTVRFTINEGTSRENTYDRKSFLILSTQNSE